MHRNPFPFLSHSPFLSDRVDSRTFSMGVVSWCPRNNHCQAPRPSSADPISSGLPKRQLERQPRCPCSSLPLAASERDEKPIEWRAAHILFVSIRVHGSQLTLFQLRLG